MEQLSAPLEAIESIYRENLFLAREVRPPSAALVVARVVALLKEHGTPAIVYVPRVNEAERLLAGLRHALADTAEVVETYHGAGASGTKALSDAERARVLAQFLSAGATVVVATCAFGLGINKRGIRQIIHDGAPIDFLDGCAQPPPALGAEKKTLPALHLLLVARPSLSCDLPER